MGSAAYFAQILTNGLHNGAIYALLAYGYVLTYSVTHRANLAHGAVFAFSGQIMVLGATFGYTTLWMTLSAAIAFGVGISIICSAILLVILARFIFPPLITQASNMMIAATLALAIVLMEGVRIGADTKDYWLPPLLSFQVFVPITCPAPSLNALQIINILVVCVTIAAAQMALTSTSFGRSLTAVSDDPLAAKLLSVNVDHVMMGAILAGGGLASLAGILATLYFGNMSFGSGLVFGLKLLFITAAGGFTSPLRGAGAAFVFAQLEAMWDGYLPIIWREPVMYGVLALLLCLRTENNISLLVKR